MRRIDAPTYATRDLGLLLLRLVVGFSMAAFHGYGKISGGPERWARIGAALPDLGIHGLHTFWGFMAGFAEFGCSLLLMLGLFFRPAAALLGFNMCVAISRHLRLPAGEESAGWNGASHALEFLGVYLALFLTGPGPYALGVLRRK
ncbi:MAG TPA: DoxX family protein [Candidatus Krumholzibacteria bacterium]|nr:DoxX family protein [Candidatus Krumholzibacteria bacterium]